METIWIGFFLGIGAFIVIASLVLGIIAFFKGIKLKTSLRDEVTYVDNRITDAFNQLNTSATAIENGISTNTDEIYRTMDSRLDKLEKRLTK